MRDKALFSQHSGVSEEKLQDALQRALTDDAAPP